MARSQPLGRNRLQHIIDRVEIERLDREMLVRGDEDDRRGGGAAWPASGPRPGRRFRAWSCRAGPDRAKAPRSAAARRRHRWRCRSPGASDSRAQITCIRSTASGSSSTISVRKPAAGSASVMLAPAASAARCGNRPRPGPKRSSRPPQSAPPAGRARWPVRCRTPVARIAWLARAVVADGDHQPAVFVRAAMRDGHRLPAGGDRVA